MCNVHSIFCYVARMMPNDVVFLLSLSFVFLFVHSTAFIWDMLIRFTGQYFSFTVSFVLNRSWKVLLCFILSFVLLLFFFVRCHATFKQILGLDCNFYPIYGFEMYISSHANEQNRVEYNENDEFATSISCKCRLIRNQTMNGRGHEHWSVLSRERERKRDELRRKPNKRPRNGRKTER